MSWRTLLLAPLLAHALLCIARIPHAVIGKRLGEVREIARQGDAAYLLARNGLAGHELIEWLRAHTPERCALLYGGTRRGSLEFAAALLWPRLLLSRIPPGADHAFGLPLAHVKLDGQGSGVPTLVGRERGLALELR